MTRVTGGFKGWCALSIEQELTKEKKGREGPWTVPSRRATRLKPPESAVAASLACDLFGGRLSDTRQDEHDTTIGGIEHE